MTHHAIRRPAIRRAILLALSALTIAVASAPAASADLDFSHGCTGRGPLVLDPKSHVRRAVYCPNFVAPVYGRGSVRIDTLRTTISWFVAATLAPDGQAVPFQARDRRVELALARLDGHALIALELS
jgi:hypothetical protein